MCIVRSHCDKILDLAHEWLRVDQVGCYVFFSMTNLIRKDPESAEEVRSLIASGGMSTLDERLGTRSSPRASFTSFYTDTKN